MSGGRRGGGHELAAVEARRAAVERRLGEVRAVLAVRGAAAALLETRRNFSWLTAGGLSHVVLATERGVAGLLVTERDAVVLSPSIETARLAEEELHGLDLAIAPVDWFEPLAMGSEARRRARGRLLDDHALEDDLMPLRARLDRLDQQRLAHLGRQTRSVLDTTMAAVEVGETEQAAAGRLVGGLMAVGLRAPVVLAAADARIERYRHPLPTDAPIRRRVMLVVVAERVGLHVAATRFREFEMPDAELRRRIDAVAEVQRALRQATRPGATLGDCFAAAQTAYARAGFPDEWRLHHQGGLIGYQGRERIAVPTDPMVIEPGMAFAWNPSITGTKVEETFLLDDSGRRRPILA